MSSATEGRQATMDCDADLSRGNVYRSQGRHHSKTDARHCGRRGGCRAAGAVRRTGAGHDARWVRYRSVSRLDAVTLGRRDREIRRGRGAGGPANHAELQELRREQASSLVIPDAGRRGSAESQRSAPRRAAAPLGCSRSAARRSSSQHPSAHRRPRVPRPAPAGAAALAVPWSWSRWKSSGSLISVLQLHLLGFQMLNFLGQLRQLTLLVVGQAPRLERRRVRVPALAATAGLRGSDGRRCSAAADFALAQPIAVAADIFVDLTAPSNTSVLVTTLSRNARS